MSILERLISPVTPLKCMVCQVEGKRLCDSCMIDALVARPSTCVRCNTLTQNYKTCESCRRFLPILHGWALFEYNKPVKKLVTEMKFTPTRAIAREIGWILSQNSPFYEHDIVTYVPTSPKHIRERAFDHAKMISSYYSAPGIIKSTRLLRCVSNSSQVGSGRLQRQSQARFKYESTGKDLSGMKVLLIDDIITTGATVASCARLLRDAGASEVNLLCLAKKN